MGWKIGYCVVLFELMVEFWKVYQYNIFVVYCFIQYVLADYLQDVVIYQSLLDFYQCKCDLLLEVMVGLRFKLFFCQGIYFCNFDYFEISDELDWVFVY